MSLDVEAVTELRLIVQRREWMWGGNIPIPEVYYFLQARSSGGPWQTIPVLDHDTLPADEQAEILAACKRALGQ